LWLKARSGFLRFVDDFLHFLYDFLRFVNAFLRFGCWRFNF
jgi:hypothetical protein